jgi:hypothetical protein
MTRTARRGQGQRYERDGVVTDKLDGESFWRAPEKYRDENELGERKKGR